jgi:hypothetical protein
MRDAPDQIIEELREMARFEALEFGEPKEESMTWSAADYIEHLTKALERIHAGETDPQTIAREALDKNKWIFG